MAKIQKTREEWKTLLSDEAFRVLIDKGTERPFTGEYDNHYEEGAYCCNACGNKLFDSSAKFNAGCGWPSFSDTVTPESIAENVDKSYGMVRQEVVCSNCGGHLGHVFPDGPAPTGLRYCINSVSIKFVPKEKT